MNQMQKTRCPQNKDKIDSNEFIQELLHGACLFELYKSSAMRIQTKRLYFEQKRPSKLTARTFQGNASHLDLLASDRVLGGRLLALIKPVVLLNFNENDVTKHIFVSKSH